MIALVLLRPKRRSRTLGDQPPEGVRDLSDEAVGAVRDGLRTYAAGPGGSDGQEPLQPVRVRGDPSSGAIHDACEAVREPEGFVQVLTGWNRPGTQPTDLSS